MDAGELLKTWPSWAKANAETILSSPAWRLPVKFAGTDAVMTRLPGSDPFEGGEIALDVAFESERHVLSVADSELIGDLHLLWSRREAMDPNLLLALAERSCGALFQLLEDVFRREFSVIGVHGFAAPSDRRMTFAVAGLKFAMDISPSQTVALGRLECLDPGHESIRALTRPARYRYAAVDGVAPEALGALAEGDAIVMTGFEANDWLTELPDDGRLHVCAREGAEIAFAAFADGELPRPADDDRLALVSGGRIVADGEFSRIGDVKCFKLTHLHS